jgi:hypothetical protein
VVDPLIGLGDEHRQRATELMTVAKAGPSVHRALETRHHDPESAVPVLWIAPEHEHRGQSHLAVAGEQAKVPSRGEQVDS